MDFFVGSTIVLGVWAAVGPLVGVRYGDELSQRAKRRQWLADERTEGVAGAAWNPYYFNDNYDPVQPDGEKA